MRAPLYNLLVSLFLFLGVSPCIYKRMHVTASLIQLAWSVHVELHSCFLFFFFKSRLYPISIANGNTESLIQGRKRGKKKRERNLRDD